MSSAKIIKPDHNIEKIVHVQAYEQNKGINTDLQIKGDCNNEEANGHSTA